MHFPSILLTDKTKISIKILGLTMKIIGQFEVKHSMMLPMKTITPLLTVSTYIITSITTRPVGLAVI